MTIHLFVVSFLYTSCYKLHVNEKVWTKANNKNKEDEYSSSSINQFVRSAMIYQSSFNRNFQSITFVRNDCSFDWQLVKQSLDCVIWHYFYFSSINDSTYNIDILVLLLSHNTICSLFRFILREFERVLIWESYIDLRFDCTNFFTFSLIN